MSKCSTIVIVNCSHLDVLEAQMGHYEPSFNLPCESTLSNMVKLQSGKVLCTFHPDNCKYFLTVCVDCSTKAVLSTIFL